MIRMAILAGAASTQDLRHKPSDVGASIDRGLIFLAKDAMAWDWCGAADFLWHRLSNEPLEYAQQPLPMKKRAETDPERIARR